MQSRNATSCLIALLMATGLAAAENPFAGTWKLNPAKSKFTGDTMKFERTSSGEIHWSGAGLAYTFKIDGKEYPGPVGDLVAWKQVDEHTWETTYRLKGTLVSTDTSTLSPDGKTMTIISKGTKPNGQSFQNTSVYERTSGESGLVGTWKSKEVKISSPGTLKLTPAGDDGIVWEFVDFKATCNAKFDGKDYPCTGPTAPAGISVALKRTGPRSYDWTEKLNGKLLFTGTVTVSQDGRTLTNVGKPVAVNEPITEVYERQ
jgi:hypothetical protein